MSCYVGDSRLELMFWKCKVKICLDKTFILPITLGIKDIEPKICAESNLK